MRPVFPSLNEIGREFERALQDGQVSNSGPHATRFERELEALLGLHVAVVNSGHTALMLMLRAAGIADGEVVVPSYTFASTAHAVAWCGAAPAFADISGAGSFALCPRSVRDRSSSSMRAVLAVDLYGIPSDYAALERLAEDCGVPVLLDSAPAFGAAYQGRHIGGFGLAQAFSFHATKPFPAMEGGCVTSADEALIRAVRELRNFGQSDGADCRQPGMNGKMLEVCALVGSHCLRGMDETRARRAHLAHRYREMLGTLPGLSFAAPPPAAEPVWCFFPILVDAGVFGLERDELLLALQRENIRLRAYFSLPCHRMSAYRGLPTVTLPVTDSMAAAVLPLPVYNDMRPAEQDRIVEAIAVLQRHAHDVRKILRGRGGTA